MSVRGERVVIRERDRDGEREWSEAPRKTYTTVKRYQVPEAVRSVFRGEEEEKDTKIIVRRREPSPPREEIDIRIREREREAPREEASYRVTERITRERSPPRRDIAYRVVERDSDFERRSGPRSEFREQQSVRAPSPPSPERVREFRFERNRDYSPARTRVSERPYDIEKYTKNTEYYSQPQPIIIRESAPQPIIIREERRDPVIIREERREPIVIREERPEPQYEFIEREEVRDESRSLVKSEAPRSEAPRSEAPPPPAPSAPPAPEPEESYFYERRIREIERPKRRDESYEDRRTEVSRRTDADRRSEVRPRDSASQWSSDDSYEYVRRERTYDDDGRRSRSRSRSHSPHHRRHLAEGAIAGIGAAEILGHHRRQQGKGGNRIGRGLAGGVIGAVGAEAISRVRSRSRRRKSVSESRSRSRSRSSSYDSRRTRRNRKRRSRSRSKSLSRAQQLGGLAAVAAVGALAGYVIKNKGKNETVIINDAPPPRRSRSRGRRASVDSYMTSPLSDGGGRAMDPDHRNRRIAQAGLASAAAAGIWDRVRSKSRGGRARSKSRVQQGVPIAAAGLGGAALAGLYEKNKANKEAKKAAVIASEVDRGRRRRSRSRSRSVPAPYPPDDRSVDDQGLIAYGNEPIYPEDQRGYYSDEEPGMYRRRHYGGSDGSSPDTRRRSQSRRRSRSRAQDIAGVAAAAGVAGVAAHEYGKRKERSRSRQAEQRRREDEPYNDPYSRNDQENAGYLPQQQNEPYDNRQAYPQGNYFAPPPTGGAATQDANAYPAYNPADYAQGGQHHQPYPQSYGAYDSSANLGAPYPGGETYAGDPHYPPEQREGRRGREPDDVSAPPTNAAASAAEHEPREPENADGVNTPTHTPVPVTARPAARSRSRSRVRFDMNRNTEHHLEQQGNAKEEPGNDSGRKDERRRRKKKRSEDDDGQRRPSSQLMNDKYDRKPNDSDSEGTVELPERFDEHGNRKAGEGDQLANTINQFLGSAGITDLLGSLGGGGGRHDSDESRSGRRRHRR